MNKIKDYFKNNDGYTLVEMIIVIAMILNMTTASFISLRVMHAAKAKEAASSFETELADVISNNKNKSVDINLDDKITSVDKDYVMGLKFYSVGNDKVYIQRCIFKKDDTGVYSIVSAPDDTEQAYLDSINVGKGKGTCLSAYVDVVYKDKNGNETKITGDTETYLRFNKRGECVEGVGTYEFLRKNGDKVATIVVRQNGSFN